MKKSRGILRPFSPARKIVFLSCCDVFLVFLCVCGAPREQDNQPAVSLLCARWVYDLYRKLLSDIFSAGSIANNSRSCVVSRNGMVLFVLAEQGVVVGVELAKHRPPDLI